MDEENGWSSRDDEDMKIYITVCCDRHIDNDIKAHRTLRKANAYLNKWMKEYDNLPYGWETLQDADDEKNRWIRWVQAKDFDDGPSAHIEVLQLK